MNWTPALFGLNGILIVALVARLFTLRLYRQYRAFVAFLCGELLLIAIIFGVRFSRLNGVMDYRLTWLVSRLFEWVVAIWMVYALLRSIFAKLPGILRFSKRALNILFPASIALAMISAIPEYLAADGAGGDWMDRTLAVAFIVERVVSTVSLLCLLGLLIFIFWFPVRMPKNLAALCVGFGLYFGSKNTLLVARSFWSHQSFNLVDIGISAMLSLCLGYWLKSFNPAGEETPVTLGHSWQVNKQDKLMHDLESINAALARASRR